MYTRIYMYIFCILVGILQRCMNNNILLRTELMHVLWKRHGRQYWPGVAICMLGDMWPIVSKCWFPKPYAQRVQNVYLENLKCIQLYNWPEPGSIARYPSLFLSNRTLFILLFVHTIIYSFSQIRFASIAFFASRLKVTCHSASVAEATTSSIFTVAECKLCCVCGRIHDQPHQQQCSI